MRRLGKFVIACVLVGLLCMDGLAFQVSSEVQMGSYRSFTKPMQDTGNPLVGNITLVTQQSMWEGVPTDCAVNVTLAVNSKTPMDLTITDVTIIFKTPDKQYRWMGSLFVGMLEVSNTTGLQIQGTVTITPQILSEGGNVSIGVMVGYLLDNHTLERSNSWGGEDGIDDMTEVHVVPAIFQSQIWIFVSGMAFIALTAACITDWLRPSSQQKTLPRKRPRTSPMGQCGWMTRRL